MFSQTGAPTGAWVDKHPASAYATLAWLVVALALTLVFVGRSMLPALDPATVHEDARQHVFWMQRFRDPELFPNDLIADYFQSVAPPGYVVLYRLLSRFADPLWVSKILPWFAGTIVAVLVFRLSLFFHPSPIAAFLTCTLVGWYTWQDNDLASGTPRAFLLPILCGLLVTLAAGRPWLTVVVGALGTLFYPVAGPLAVSLLGVRLLTWHGRPGISRKWSSWLPFLAAIALVGAALLAGQQGSQQYGPVPDADQARAMPIFGPRGREAFFFAEPYQYWIVGFRSGFDMRAADVLLGRLFSVQVPLMIEYLVLAALLPMLLIVGRSSVLRVRPESVVLLHLLAASLGLFVLAHLFLFKLYLPSRYVRTSVPLALALAGGVALWLLIELLTTRLPQVSQGFARAAGGLAVGLILLLYPSASHVGLVRDTNRELTAFLREQPKGVLVAGPTELTDFIPTFSGRSVLTSREYILPLHLGYHEELDRRTSDLIRAYYSDSADEIVRFADRYGVDLLLVAGQAFRDGDGLESWTLRDRFEPYGSMIQRRLRSTRGFALQELAGGCAVFESSGIAVLPVDCLRRIGQGCCDGSVCSGGQLTRAEANDRYRVCATARASGYHGPLSSHMERSIRPQLPDTGGFGDA